MLMYLIECFYLDYIFVGLMVWVVEVLVVFNGNIFWFYKNIKILFDDNNYKEY